VASCFGCCSVGIRARHDCGADFGLRTEACKARLCGVVRALKTIQWHSPNCKVDHYCQNVSKVKYSLGDEMTTKAELRTVLDALIGDADEQTQLHDRAQQRLYLTLGGAYLWWREARTFDGFLEELYAERRLVHRGSEENFTRLVRLVWQLGWDGMTPKLQNWARALRGLHHEYETNKDAYQVQNPQDKVRQFFQAMGGIGAVGVIVSPLQMTDEEIASAKTKASSSKKTKLDILSEQQIHVKHIELGELFFAAEDPYIKNIVSKSKKLDVTRKGYAVALVKKSANGSYVL